MGKVIINYSEIINSAKRAKSASNYYAELHDNINKQIKNKLASAPGSDKTGYIGIAQDLMNRKMMDATNKRERLSNLSNNLHTLKNTIKSHEDTIQKNIKNIAQDELELKGQSKWKSIMQWIYGTVCVDALNWNPITRALGNIIKSVNDKIQTIQNKIVDWFKYGNGKYVLNIVVTAAGVVSSILATVGAVALAVGTGGLAIPLVIAAVASVVATVMTAGDAIASIFNNVKALENSHKNHDPGRARYYGDISGVNDLIKKTDMGGEQANKTWEFVGKSYDTTHAAAEITAAVAGSYGKAGLKPAKATVDPQTGKLEKVKKYVYDPQKAKTNYPKIIKEKVGFVQKNGKWTWDYKKLIGKKSKHDLVHLSEMRAEKNTELGMEMFKAKHSNLGKVYEVVDKNKKILSYPKKFQKYVDNAGKKIGFSKDMYKNIKFVNKKLGDQKERTISNLPKDLDNTIFKAYDTWKKVS